jgi:hypothetical protein
MTAEEIIAAVALRPHPEGGHFVETWRDVTADGRRGHGTAIYYLLRGGEISAWHKVDATEIWHFYAGAPLALKISADGQETREALLGANIAAGERPQIIVPANAWQSARSTGEWTLVGCTVSPAFAFSGFEIAPKEWRPGGAVDR